MQKTLKMTATVLFPGTTSTYGTRDTATGVHIK